ncbi:hypothetical protein D9619_008045 [Psilocybe cf. subviscida]|uniref:HNH nuclease domain-containing protein n=1 Tax=Psilocybe cf. subviscida TaxID=2480587 RepID=A0A8H5ESK2_9AGAR|nr:hypothetical protein D9619_008045 [Psilocybe cf. subviscida]
MTQLPPTIPPKFLPWSDVADVDIAYDRCLREEKRLMDHNQGPETRWALVRVRILGYLIDYAPTNTGARGVVDAINSCATDAQLHDLGGLYRQAWIRAFQASKSQTPTPSNDPSRPSFDATHALKYDGVDPAPRNHSASKKSALVRDDFRCLVTGEYDVDSLSPNDPLLATLGAGDITRTKCCHVFNESTSWDVLPVTDPNKRSWAASMWATMSRFGYDSLPEDLNGDKVHRLENVLTLSHVIHGFFDSLEIWFVETGDNEYRLESVPGPAEIFARNYPTVKFTSAKPDLDLALPSPDYLAIHAACAKVAHLSGASEWFKEFEDDLDEHTHKTLANDGASASLLYNALQAHAEWSNVVE